MPITTTISLPENLAREVEKQMKEGNFASRSEFFRTAVKNYLALQETVEQESWEEFARPFREWAKKKGLTEKDILKAVEESRYGKASQGRR